MQITCPHCQRKYNVEANKLAQLRRRNPSCKNCGARLFTILEEAETVVQSIDKRPPSVAPKETPAPDEKVKAKAVPDDLPKTIGTYSIKGVLGRGAMGYVYKGFDESLRRYVAIKVLSPELKEQMEFRERFNVEAQALATLVHPNITQIYSAGQEGEKLYFAMEYVDGHSADDVLHRKGKFQALEALSIVKQVCEGLKQASEKGIIHRDIKPGNILLANDGITKITDFGIAKIVKQDQGLTSTGMMIGTPAYTSPEQARGDKTDFRTDIYSLGATFYQLLVGRPPFEADSSMNVLMMHITEPLRFPMGPTGPIVPPQLTGIIRKMMAKKADDRFLSYDALLLELSRVEGKLREEMEPEKDPEESMDLKVKTIPQGTIDLGTSNKQASVAHTEFVGNDPVPLRYKVVAALAIAVLAFFGYQKWSEPPTLDEGLQAAAPPAGIKIESFQERVQPGEPIKRSSAAIAEPATIGDVSQVSVTDSKMEQLDQATYRIFGTVRNLGTDKVKSVFVEVALRNIFEEVIASRKIEAEPRVILPGELARFSVLFKNVTDVADHTTEILENTAPE